MHRGYVKLWRKMAESRTWSRGATTIGVAVALVLRANHRPGWFAGRQIRRGQLALGQEAFATEMGLSRSQLRRILENLTADAFLSTIPANRYTLVTILKYDTYQDAQEVNRPSDDTAEDTTEEPAGETAEGATGGTSGGQQPATNKNEKNEKKVCVSRARARGVAKAVDKSGRDGGRALNGGAAGWKAPTETEVRDYALQHGRCINEARFCAYWESVGWSRGGKRVTDWRPLVKLWRDDREQGLEEWTRCYNTAKRDMEALIESQGTLAAGQATEAMSRVRGDLGTFYRPGDKPPNDAAWMGVMAAVDAWKARPRAAQREGVTA